MGTGHSILARMSDRLAALYPAHLKTVIERHDKALAATRFDSVVIAAGEPIYAFLDDNTYPFRPNPHFKHWVPVTTNPHCFVVYKPGAKPMLVYWQPVDYWYKPAGAPSGFWVEHFDIRVIGDPADADQHLPKSGNIAVIAEQWGNTTAQFGLSTIGTHHLNCGLGRKG